MASSTSVLTLRRMIVLGGLLTAAAATAVAVACRPQRSEAPVTLRPPPDSERALSLLDTSLRAIYQLTFEGLRETTLFRAGEPIKRYEQTVAAREGLVRWEVTAPQAEAGRITLRRPGEMWEYYPDQQRIIVSEGSAEQVCERQQETLARRYRKGVVAVDYEGREQVLGRPAHVITVRDNAQRLARRYWLDEETSLVLAREDYDHQGRVLLATRFIEINWEAQPAAELFTPPADPQARVVRVGDEPEQMPLEQAEQRAGYEAFLPSHMPRGYGLVADQVALVDLGGVQVIWLRYCDGADRLSLFQMPREHFAQVVSAGAWDFAWENDTHGFILMGNVSAAEVARVRESTRDPRANSPAAQADARQDTGCL